MSRTFVIVIGLLLSQWGLADDNPVLLNTSEVTYAGHHPSGVAGLLIYGTAAAGVSWMAYELAENDVQAMRNYYALGLFPAIAMWEEAPLGGMAFMSLFGMNQHFVDHDPGKKGVKGWSNVAGLWLSSLAVAYSLDRKYSSAGLTITPEITPWYAGVNLAYRF